MKTNLIKILLLGKNSTELSEYHLVSISPWPLISSIMVMNNMIGMILLFNYEISTYKVYLSVLLLLITSFFWWRDINREASFEGAHCSLSYNLMLFGMILFILSEICFFVSFFWGFFFLFKGGDVLTLGGVWPPKSFILFNPSHIPLLNSLLLLSSGGCLTVSHFMLLNMNLKSAKSWLFLTLFLGLLFTMIQMLEYFEASFTLMDSSFGSIFFTSTGFHGFHVMIGTCFLMIILGRMKKAVFSSEEHSGFNNSAWYWHFVDVVWLFLYISFYWMVY